MKSLLRFLISAYFKIFYHLEVHGTVPEGPVILAPNHMHVKDPFLINTVYKADISAIAKAELFKNPFIRLIFKPLEIISVDRDANDIKAIRQAIEALKRMTLVIFPEGTRNPSDTPLPGKPGVPMIAAKASVPIVPVVLTGTYKLFSTLRVDFLEAIDVKAYGFARWNSEAYQSIADDILERIYQKKDEIRENHHR